MVELGGDMSAGWFGGGIVLEAGMRLSLGGTAAAGGGGGGAAAGAFTALLCLWFLSARSCWLIFCHLRYETNMW
jgi:hypothetical protein